MPYQKGTVPDLLKGKGIPQKFIDLFIEIFNSVYERTGDESSAYQQAYGVMVRELRKAGYRQGRDRKWHKVKMRESFEEGDMLYALPLSASQARVTILEGQTRERALSEGLRFEGVALIDHAISQQGTSCQRYYSPEFNDHCLKRTEDYMRLGHTVTIYNSHGAALGGLFSLPDESPIGKVVRLWREGDEIRYEGFIAPTRKGRDQIELILNGIVSETSVRIAEPKYAQRKIEEGKESDDESFIDEMLDGFIIGIDFCDEAGIPGAGMTRILESRPLWLVQNVKEDEMEWDKITLEDLRAHVPHLLEEHAQSVRAELPPSPISEEELKALRDKLQALEAEIEGLKPLREQLQEMSGILDGARAKIESLQRELKLREAAETPFGKLCYELLKAKQPTEENLAEAAKEAREEALNQVAIELQGGTQWGGKGRASFPNVPDVGDEARLELPDEFVKEEVEDLYRFMSRLSRR